MLAEFLLIRLSVLNTVQAIVLNSVQLSRKRVSYSYLSYDDEKYKGNHAIYAGYRFYHLICFILRQVEHLRQ